MIRQESDTGVSPVVGIILMVAVTVALVALAANFVFNIGGESSTSAAATIDLAGDAANNAVEAQLIKNENADSIKVEATDGTNTESGTLSSAGDTLDLTNAGFDGNTVTVTVIATVDGEDQVLQSQEFDL